MNVEEVTRGVKAWRRELDGRLGQARVLHKRINTLEAEIASLKEAILLYSQASIIMNTIGKDRQEKLQHQVESLVTSGLQSVFDDSYSFHLLHTQKGNRPDVRFIVRTTLDDGRQIDTDVIDGRGGGISVLVGFLLRVVVLMLTNQGKDTFLVLDESFSDLSKEYVPLAIDFIKELVEKTGVQILMITHQDEFMHAADKVYQFDLVNGETKIKEWTE